MPLMMPSVLAKAQFAAQPCLRTCCTLAHSQIYRKQRVSCVIRTCQHSLTTGKHPLITSLPQGLAGEARRLSTTIAAQEREAAAREGALTAAAEETAKAQSELAESQLHLQQAVADVQVPN